MSHRVTLKTVRTTEHDATMQCDVSRIVGYRLVCACGQRSPVKSRVADLRAWEHLRQRR